MKKTLAVLMLMLVLCAFFCAAGTAEQSIEVPNKEITALTETDYDVVFRHPDALAWVVFEKRIDKTSGEET